MDELFIKIGKKLKKARKEQNLTQEKLSKMAGISQTHYGRIERGEVETTLGTIIKIVSSLKITMSYIMSDRIIETASDDEIHKLIKELDIANSYYAEEMVMNYIEKVKREKKKNKL